MTNSQKVLENWTTLKTQLLKTLTELKANHKDNWKVIKHKSAPEKLAKFFPFKLSNALQEKEKYFQQLRWANEKYDRLNDKLNWLRTLVRAGDIQQLQELVRQAKI